MHWLGHVANLGSSVQSTHDKLMIAACIFFLHNFFAQSVHI